MQARLLSSYRNYKRIVQKIIAIPRADTLQGKRIVQINDRGGAERPFTPQGYGGGERNTLPTVTN